MFICLHIHLTNNNNNILVHQCAIRRARSNDLSVWLTVLPIAANSFDLISQELCDAFAIRYKKPLFSVPPCCDGCSAPSTIL